MKVSGKLATENLKDLDKSHLSSEHEKVPRVWIVTADKHTAKVYKKSGKHLQFLGEITPGNDAAGREGFGEGSVHHKYSPDNDPAKQVGIIFAKHLAEWLNNAVQENAFDKLVLAAAPHTLGDLRKELNKQVQQKISAEVNKDLTKHNEAALEKDLADVVWP